MSSLARYGTTSARREIAQRLTVMVREARLKPRCSFSLPGAGSGSPPAATDPRAGAVEADAPKNCEAKASMRLWIPAALVSSARERISLVWRRRRCRRR